MKLPLPLRLTLAVAVRLERLSWLAWSLHARAAEREVARVPPRPVDPAAVDAMWSRIETALAHKAESFKPGRFVSNGYVRLDERAFELRDQAGELLASGAGLLGFARQMLSGGRAS